MIDLLITTGKKPGRTARSIAKALLFAIPGACLENRGRRTLSSLISKARSLGFSRLCSIHSGNGAPRAIEFFEIGAEKGWKRLQPAIIIKKISLPDAKIKSAQSGCLKITGTKAKEASSLISPRNSSDEAGSRIAASAKKLAISVSNKKIIELGVSYGKQG